MRAWKTFDWDAMDRLHEKDLISDPKSKAKSVVLTEESRQAAEEAFRRVFASWWGACPWDLVSTIHDRAWRDLLRHVRASGGSQNLPDRRIILRTFTAGPGCCDRKPLSYAEFLSSFV
jgi:hypothetical protein